MFCLSAPSLELVSRILDGCSRRAPNHSLLETVDLAQPLRGFRRDVYGAELGNGEAVWHSARSAIDARAMYPAKWTVAHEGPGPRVVGAPFVSVIHHFGFHSVLPGRVHELIDTDGPARRYGFAFLTLDGHAEQGVERFVVSWDEGTDLVRYEVTALSRPAGVVRLGAPLARFLQRRFRRDSIASMQRAIQRS